MLISKNIFPSEYFSMEYYLIYSQIGYFITLVFDLKLYQLSEQYVPKFQKHIMSRKKHIQI
jgi:hypothetical protein